MKTIADIVVLLKNGAKPVVEFGSAIGDKEHYAETGMRARAIRVQNEGDSVVGIVFQFGEFDAHNLPLEQTNYYDKSGNPTLTAREAGYYRPEDNVYFDLDEPLEKLFSIVAAERLALYEQYLASAAGESYISWLETKFLAAN